MVEKQIRGCIHAECVSNVDNPVYQIDHEYNVYVLPTFGAWMGDIENESHLKKYWDYKLNGYELILGPASSHYGGYGVYCKNYRELYQSKLDYIDEIMKRKDAAATKKLLIQMWLNDEWITTSPRIDFQLKEVFRLIMATTPPREDFSEESINRVEKVLFLEYKPSTEVC